MMSVGTAQEFRSSAWNAPPSGVWTSVQNSSAWPIEHTSFIKTQPVVNQKFSSSSSLVGSPSSFQWTNSWESVLPSRAIKKSSLPFATSPSVNVPIPIKSKKTLEPSTSLPYEAMISSYEPSPILHGLQSSPIGHHETEVDELYGSPEDDPFGKKKKKSPEEKQLIEDELSKQNLYKTELCRSFCETGICRYGHKCQFAHGEHELRPVMRHPKYKTETCKTFSNTGTCPYGNRCRFIHPGVTYGSWPEDGISDTLIGSMEQLSISPTLHQPILSHPHIHGFQVDQPVIAPTGSFDMKDKESDVKSLVEDDSDSKPRLAFFQNLTVI